MASSVLPADRTRGSAAPADVYGFLLDLVERPSPFSVGGPHELWTDPHVQEQMLAFHFDPEVAAASPTTGFIDRATAWIVEAFHVDERTRVLDLGCGPGLYANRLARRAGRVEGIDLSAAAIREARWRASSDRARFQVGDYLAVPLPEHDVALLLMRDYCAMSGSDRVGLLERVRASMTAGGRILVDVDSPVGFVAREESCSIEVPSTDGFWAPGDHATVHQTLLYPDERVVLDRYVIVEPDRSRKVHSWTAYLTVEEVREEFASAGFTVVEVLGDVAGGPYDAEAPGFAIVATPI